MTDRRLVLGPTGRRSGIRRSWMTAGSAQIVVVCKSLGTGLQLGGRGLRHFHLFTLHSQSLDSARSNCSVSLAGGALKRPARDRPNFVLSTERCVLLLWDYGLGNPGAAGETCDLEGRSPRELKTQCKDGSEELEHRVTPDVPCPVPQDVRTSKIHAQQTADRLMAGMLGKEHPTSECIVPAFSQVVAAECRCDGRHLLQLSNPFSTTTQHHTRPPLEIQIILYSSSPLPPLYLPSSPCRPLIPSLQAVGWVVIPLLSPAAQTLPTGATKTRVPCRTLSMQGVLMAGGRSITFYLYRSHCLPLVAGA